MRSIGSPLACLEDSETGVLDFRGVLAVCECARATGFCFEDAAGNIGFGFGLGVEGTFTTFVAILRGAFFAFMAENDMGRPSAGNDPILGARTTDKPR